jgi:NAD(P)-dependent dehydrogenase (short-subunit alcohol dehydrogenase family)
MTFEDHQGKSLDELYSLGGRTAVVTGGAQGIGYAMSERMAEAGASVVIADIDREGAADAADRLAAAGYEASSIYLDATDAASHAEAAGAAVERTGSLDVWVNNAGVFLNEPALEMTDDDWQGLIDLNLSGVFYGAREAARVMRDHGGGVIINTVSTNAWHAAPGFTHYVASKAGLTGLTRNLAVELAGDDIRVLGVAPTLVQSEGLESMREELTEAFGMDPVEAFAGRNPAGRAAVPDEIGRVTAFLASDAAGFMTGATIPVDGGELTG